MRHDDGPPLTWSGEEQCRHCGVPIIAGAYLLEDESEAPQPAWLQVGARENIAEVCGRLGMDDYWHEPSRRLPFDLRDPVALETWLSA